MEEFYIFTDGSAIDNQQNACAGSAIFIPTVKRLWSKGMRGTNNQAELNAIQMALYYMTKKYSELEVKDNRIFIASDSEYAINVVFKNYNAKTNLGLITRCKNLIKELEGLEYEIVPIHVTAHSGGNDFMSINNDIVDKAAREEATKMKKLQEDL